MNLIALTRSVSASIVNCQLTYLERAPIDVSVARAQHHEYESVLTELGCRVMQIGSVGEMPDSVFIEDTAVVLDELAVMCRPGAESRREEVNEVAGVLWIYRRLEYIQEPGTLDGGDVLVAGRTIFVGRSSRTNHQGIEQLAQLCEPLGYTVSPVVVQGCLHLKSAVTAIGDQELLVNPEWVDVAGLRPYDTVHVHPSEAAAANVIRLGGTLLASAAFPRTASRLEHRGYVVRTVDMSELAKAEGAVTCCSLIFRDGL